MLRGGAAADASLLLESDARAREASLPSLAISSLFPSALFPSLFPSALFPSLFPSALSPSLFASLSPSLSLFFFASSTARRS